MINLNNITHPLGLGRLYSHVHFMLGRWLYEGSNRVQCSNDLVLSSVLEVPEVSIKMHTLGLLVGTSALEYDLKQWPLGACLANDADSFSSKKVKILLEFGM